MRLLWGLTWILISSCAWAEIDWLKASLVELDSQSSLVKSYTHKNQTYLYDQALTLITLTHAKEFKKAKLVAGALKKLQLPNGSWYFSYYLDGSSPYPKEGDMRPMGAIAWTALALVTYEFHSKDKTFHQQWKNALQHLEKNMVKINGFKGEGIRFSQFDNPKTSWNEKDLVALEHVLDAMAAFKAAYQLTQKNNYKKKQLVLESFAMELWDEGAGHFWPGVNIKTSKINRAEFYLDNQSWSALALEHLDLKDMMKRSLQSSCELAVKQNGVVGFKEAKRSIASEDFIWSEGTAGKALALQKYGVHCQELSHDSYVSSLDKMKINGGVLYANKNVPNFEAQPSVAGTAWTWFLKNKINPFRL